MVKVRVHIFVSGRVQGVFFRQNTKQQADNFGVKGWIGNLQDGRVEAVFEGEEQDVKLLTEYCHHGPSYSTVTKVDVALEDYVGKFRDFETR